MKTLGIITYDVNHLKTEQILLQLVGKYRLQIYALPYVQRPARKVLFQHRPNQLFAAHPREICQQYDLPYIPVESDTQIDNSCELYLITGAGILTKKCLHGKRVLNGHPGIIPAARGLDAFKWSIYNLTPLGVTLHYVDEQVDAGEIVSIVPTPVFPSDTLETLARRHYENEINILSHFYEHLLHPQNPFPNIPQKESTCRMNAVLECSLGERFMLYKQQFLPVQEAVLRGQMSPPRKYFEFCSLLCGLQKGAA